MVHFQLVIPGFMSNSCCPDHQPRTEYSHIEKKVTKFPFSGLVPTCKIGGILAPLKFLLLVQVSYGEG